MDITYELGRVLLKIFSISTNRSGEKESNKTSPQALKDSGDVLKIEEKDLKETTKICRVKQSKRENTIFMFEKKFILKMDLSLLRLTE